MWSETAMRQLRRRLRTSQTSMSHYPFAVETSGTGHSLAVELTQQISRHASI